MSTVDELLTVQEVAAYLKKSPSWVYRRSREKKLPAQKVGGTWRYSMKALEQWMQAGLSGDEAQTSLPVELDSTQSSDS